MLRMARAWMLMMLLVGLVLPVLAQEAAAPSETPGIPILNQTLPNRLINVGKAYLTGKRITVDYVQRKLDDKEDGVIRITDKNYKELVEEGNKDDVWVALLHGDMTHRNSPKYYDAHTETVKLAREATKATKDFKSADGAVKLTKEEKEQLKHVKWARIDYVDEWKLCARWQVFRPPYLIIITEGGENLRFFSAGQFPAKPDIIFDFIKSGNWRNAPTYKSIFGPGGKLSFLAEAYIAPQERLQERFGTIPPIVWMLLFGYLTKELTAITTQWFNSREAAKAPPPPKAGANPKSKESVEKMEKALKEMRAKRQMSKAAEEEKKKSN